MFFWIILNYTSAAKIQYSAIAIMGKIKTEKPRRQAFTEELLDDNSIVKEKRKRLKSKGARRKDEDEQV